MIITDGIIKQNVAGAYGGGIYNNVFNGVTSMLNINGGIISHNIATNSGGIFNNSSDIVNYTSGVICENTPANQYETSSTCPS